MERGDASCPAGSLRKPEGSVTAAQYIRRSLTTQHNATASNVPRSAQDSATNSTDLRKGEDVSRLLHCVQSGRTSLGELSLVVVLKASD